MRRLSLFISERLIGLDCFLLRIRFPFSSPLFHRSLEEELNFPIDASQIFVGKFLDLAPELLIDAKEERFALGHQ
jgi:hypothetical protein